MSVHKDLLPWKAKNCEVYDFHHSHRIKKFNTQFFSFHLQVDHVKFIQGSVC